MDKYLAIFKTSFQQEFAYKLNFIMWRVRNVFSVFLIFFLWDSVFSQPSDNFFGYDRSKILTYVFGLIFVRSIVLSIRSIDMAGEIARGDVSNMIIKPVSYFKYWFTRDVASKVLNFGFSVVEAFLLYFFLRPVFYIQNDPVMLAFFIISLIFAVVLYFFLVFLFSMPPFWMPHQAWGFMFLLIVFADVLGGGIFPIDILPQSWQSVLYMTPFPYLLFIPINIYLGNFSHFDALKFVSISLMWIVVIGFLNKIVWAKGLYVHNAEGR